MAQEHHEHAQGGCSCGCGTAGACTSKTWLIATIAILAAVLAMLWLVREPEATGDAAAAKPAVPTQPVPSR